MSNTESKSKEVLFKNNKIVKAKYDLNTVQNRVYQYILYKMQQNELEAPGVYEAFISLDDFRKLIKNKNQWKVESIKTILRQLRKGTIYIELLDDKGKKKWYDYSLITGAEYSEDTGYFRIEASKTIYDLLKEYLDDGYTPVNIAIFLSLGNSYAQRLYELLRLWTNTKTVINYKVEELKELLLLEGKYNRYPDFKRRVVIPAIEELKEKAQLSINLREIYQGKKVVSLDFIVKDDDDRIYFKKESTVQNPLFDEIGLDTDDDYYIPKELRLSTSCINRFINKYKDYDFRSYVLKDCLFDAEARTLEKDNIDIIDYKSFAYFQTILDSNLEKNKQRLMDEFNRENRYKDIEEFYS